MNRTIDIDGEPHEIPPYALGDRVLYHGRPATIVGVNLLGLSAQRLRVWLDANRRGARPYSNGFTCSIESVAPMPAVDQLGSLAT